MKLAKKRFGFLSAGFAIALSTPSTSVNSALLWGQDESHLERHSQSTDYSPADHTLAMTLPVLVGDNVNHISIEVQELATISLIQLLDAQSFIVVESVTDIVSGDTMFDVPVMQGTYKFVIANPQALKKIIDISVARTDELK